MRYTSFIGEIHVIIGEIHVIIGEIRFKKENKLSVSTFLFGSFIGLRPDFLMLATVKETRVLETKSSDLRNTAQ